MKKYFLPTIVFIIVLIYFISCIYIYGVSNISFYNIALFLFASPLLEEYIFRGLVQKKINQFINKSSFFYISYGCMISSFIFALIHFIINNYSFINLLVFFPSTFLGYLYDNYKTLKLPILFHSFFNINIFISYPLHKWIFF